MTEIEELKQALQQFLNLRWFPDAAPGPSCYMVEPVHEARKALVNAGKLLHGKSPFPVDTNGTVTTFDGKRSVWLDGRAYGEDKRNLVPEKHLELFDASLKNAK